MNKKNRLTYFTPTYNRANLLPNLYESLIRQTNKDFIWLVIDDGSSDGTEELVQKWVKENKIEIKYVKKENGGKHTAIDLSNQICKTEFITCIDSDDYITDDATEILYPKFDLCKDDDVCGIVGRRAKYDGVPFNNGWSICDEKIFFYDIYKKYGYVQDTILVFKTNIIKQFHFPVFKDERFVTESVFYKQFMYDYKMIMIPECVYLAEYQEDGYTAQGIKLFYKNPKGYAYALKQNCDIDLQKRCSIKHKIACSAHYFAWIKALKISNSVADEYKIKFPYNVLGKIASILIVGKYKKGYNEFLNETRDKNKK